MPTLLPHAVLSLLLSAAATTALAAPPTPSLPPAPDHTVIVVMENRGASQILGAADAPWFNRLAAGSAVYTQSYGVTHPSQPNYLALFSGSTHGVAGNDCPLDLQGPNLAQQLLAAGKTFVGYAESLPAPGYSGCSAPGNYMRKHVPWVNFRGLPAAVNQPFSAFPQGDFKRLPTVAFVVPNQDNDMHDGSVATGDAWLQKHIGPYAEWAMAHNSLLVVTWDEDDGREGNRIATLLRGPMVKPGRYAQRIDHYDLLRTVQALHGLPAIAVPGGAAPARGITEGW